MDENTSLLVFCYSLYWVTLLALIFNSENKQRTFVLNLVIQAVYSVLFLTSLATNLFDEKMGVVFVVYLVICIAVHWVVNALGLIIIVFGNKEQELE